MFLKVIGQLIFAATLVNIMPVDASFYEYQVGVGDIESTYMTHDETIAAFSYLPESDDRFPTPVKVDTESFGIVTTAMSVVVIDDASGSVLFQKHPDSLRSIGSVTKLMAALVFLDQNPDLNEIVTLDQELDYVSGGRVYLGYHNGVSLYDLLGASLVGSDNTATQALVRFSGLKLDEFITQMNIKAQELGMERTSFADPTGLDSFNMSTARELVCLLREVEKNETISHFMQQARILITQSSGRTVEIENTNTLLTSFVNQDPYDVVGGKTGYLPQAGYVLATTVENNGNAVHILVLGSESKDARVDEVKGLAYWAFKTYEWK